jgi:hypothetical protein
MASSQNDHPVSAKKRSPIPFWVTTSICLLLMTWAASDESDSHIRFPLTGQQGDYYNLLVDGLLEGHLHMKIAPDASGNLPLHMDASLYQGKYYMYFGIVPALLTMLPYSFLTGHDMPENLATLLLVAGGFLLNLRLYVLARRRYFPGCNSPVEICSIILLAFGTGTPILVFDAGFYEMALAGGYFCLSIAMLALYQAIHGKPRSANWLALASLAAGLAVGCRPTCLLALPALLVPLIPKLRPGATDRATWIRLLGAAVIPAALVGIGLMAYNYLRFGDPFEFGFKYQMNALMSCGMPFARAKFIWKNLDWYYLTQPVFSPYFPYVLPINASLRPADYYGFELIHGQWLVLPLELTCLAGIIWGRFRRVELPSGLIAIIAVALLAFGGIFATLLTFGFRANRYVTDFQPSLILALALIGGFATAQSNAAGWLGKPYRLLFCGLTLAVSLFNYLVGIQWMDHLANTRPKAYSPLAFMGNYPAYWLAKLGWFQPSDYEFRVHFSPDVSALSTFPLMATGTNGASDTLNVIQSPDGTMEFVVTHEGYDGLHSGRFKVDLTRDHEIRVRLGTLLPPREHPYFQDWDSRDVQLVKSTVLVTFDGKTIISGYENLYTTAPAHVAFGRSPIAGSLRFPGRIFDVTRRPILNLPRPTVQKPSTGVWRLHVNLPPFTAQPPEPLLASGAAGAGNLLSVEYHSATQVRLGLDEWNYGFAHSPELNIDPTHEHTLEVFVGPQFRKHVSPPPGNASAPTAGDNTMAVWLDGNLIWNAPLRGNFDAYDFVVVGVNIQGFSTSSKYFGGQIQSDALTKAEEREISLRPRATPDSGEP